MVGLKNNCNETRMALYGMSKSCIAKAVYSCKVNYIKPLEFGGINHVNNLAIYCPSCSTFTQY